jgi:hypothetical protein
MAWCLLPRVFASQCPLQLCPQPPAGPSLTHAPLLYCLPNRLYCRYLQYAKLHGFESMLIWACPPLAVSEQQPHCTAPAPAWAGPRLLHGSRASLGFLLLYLPACLPVRFSASHLTPAPARPPPAPLHLHAIVLPAGRRLHPVLPPLQAEDPPLRPPARVVPRHAQAGGWVTALLCCQLQG